MMNQSESNEEAKKIRRARNDPNNRDYICPCGKSYLSYPALFTHIKQKHNGKAPGQITKPKNQNIKRGRPRGGSVNLIQNQQLQSDEQSLISKLSSLLHNQKIQQDQAAQFSYYKQGNNSCNEIFQLFLNEIQELNEDSYKIVKGFLWLLKKSIQEYFQNQNYLLDNNAEQIIDATNDLIILTRKKYEKQFSISQIILKNLTVIFFEWLYKNNFTNHVLKEN